MLLVFEVMIHRLPAGSDPSATTPEANVTEERRHDLDCIETGKVPGCVLAFDVQVVGLRDHACRVTRASAPVQRHF